MSKELKIVLLVVAGLAGLAVVAFLGVIAFFGFAFSRHMASATPASNAADAAKIARFTLPSGYRYLTATNLVFMNLVQIVPVRENARGPFFIQLQGISVPNSATASDANFEESMRRALGGANCATAGAEHTVVVRTKSGTDVDLHVVHCGGSGDREFAFGRIPSSYPVAVAAAAGSASSFDLDALRSLVASIR